MINTKENLMYRWAQPTVPSDSTRLDRTQPTASRNGAQGAAGKPLRPLTQFCGFSFKPVQHHSMVSTEFHSSDKCSIHHARNFYRSHEIA